MQSKNSSAVRASRKYKFISVDELKQMKEQDINIQISGIELSLEVSMLDRNKIESEEDCRLLELYYQYLLQGKKDGYSSQYLETQLKNVVSLLEKYFKHADENTFREVLV